MDGVLFFVYERIQNAVVEYGRLKKLGSLLME